MNNTTKSSYNIGDQINLRISKNVDNELLIWINGLEKGKVGPTIFSILEKYAKKELIERNFILSIADKSIIKDLSNSNIFSSDTNKIEDIGVNIKSRTEPVIEKSLPNRQNTSEDTAIENEECTGEYETSIKEDTILKKSSSENSSVSKSQNKLPALSVSPEYSKKRGKSVFATKN